MKAPRTFPRYGALPRPNRTTRTIGALIAQARARGEAVPTDDALARHLAIAPERVAMHRRLLGS